MAAFVYIAVQGNALLLTEPIPLSCQDHYNFAAPMAMYAKTRCTLRFSRLIEHIPTALGRQGNRTRLLIYGDHIYNHVRYENVLETI